MTAHESSDSSPIRSTFSNDPEMVDILDLFVDEMPSRVCKLESSFEANDEAGLRRLTHQLKGTGAGYGFLQISDAAANVEDFLVENDGMTFEFHIDELQARLETLMSICRRVTHETG